jgi:hypothetical protein
MRIENGDDYSVVIDNNNGTRNHQFYISREPDGLFIRLHAARHGINFFVSNENIDDLEIDIALEYILSGMIGILIYMFQQKPDFPEEKIVKLQNILMQGDMVNKLQRMMK